MAKNSVRFRLDMPPGLPALLEQLPIELRLKWLPAGIRKGSRIIQKRMKELCPKGGPREGEKSGKKHLRDTIGVVQRKYKSGRLLAAYIGPEYPAGAHGHLVEFGHKGVFGDMSKRVPPKPFARPAFDEKQGEAQAAIVDELKRGIESVKTAK